jgi:alpha-glucoside transport system permease protein
MGWGGCSPPLLQGVFLNIASIFGHKPQSRDNLVARRRDISPWLWLIPAFVIVGVYLIYPVVDTFRVSLYNANSSNFVGLQNYQFIFTDRTMQDTLLNNLLWIVLFTVLVLALGLLFAVLAGRVRYEAVAKSVIFIPMAISFVAAAVIWRFVYAYQPPTFTQFGLLNAIVTAVGSSPIPWLTAQNIINTGVTLPAPFHTNNFAVIIVAVWMWTGFAMVVLSAGLKGISKEVLEAARVDGANEFQIFRRITLPLISPTIALVATTMVIQALKIFDIVWVMTAGNYGTDVIATQMYKQLFNYQNFGRAGALAVILFLAILPVIFISINRFRAQEETR